MTYGRENRLSGAPPPVHPADKAPPEGEPPTRAAANTVAAPRRDATGDLWGWI